MKDRTSTFCKLDFVNDGGQKCRKQCIVIFYKMKPRDQSFLDGRSMLYNISQNNKPSPTKKK